MNDAILQYNFVGRILGPRGMTAKQLEQETGCKIMVRGRGSMRDKKKEELNRGKPNWEHLSEELHVLIQCEDTANRAKVKLLRAVDEVKKLLVPAPEGEDELKRKQLMELAIINGTYRSGADQSALAAVQMAAKQQPLAAALREFLKFLFKKLKKKSIKMSRNVMKNTEVECKIFLKVTTRELDFLSSSFLIKFQNALKNMNKF